VQFAKLTDGASVGDGALGLSVETTAVVAETSAVEADSTSPAVTLSPVVVPAGGG